jgi:4-amino-4-deoxy-L-arabinose transferase-like glycosyltransferase
VVRPGVAVGLFTVGAVLFLVAGNDMPPVRWAIVLGTIAVSLIPPVNRILGWLLDRVRQPSTRAADWTGVIVAVAAMAYLIVAAFGQERGLTPKTHDDCSYVIGARMLAHGRLWMPQHPLADFFESFYLIVKPVYCSIYFPGTALMFAPMEWLDWPTWILPVVICGACVGLLYRVVTELFDGAAGLLAAVWAVSLVWFRTLSFLVMSHVAMLFLGLLIVWAWMRWRGERRWGWAVAIGIFSGWAAITRPVDALVYAIPIGVAMAASLRKHPARQWALTAGALVAGAAPFLALQVVFNLGVTGHPLRTPYTVYLERDQPGAQFGLRRNDPSARPASSLPQKQAYYEWCRPYFQQHEPGNFYRAWFRTRQMSGGRLHPPRLLTLADTTLPGRLLLVLVPAGVLVLGSPMGWRRSLTPSPGTPGEGGGGGAFGEIPKQAPTPTLPRSTGRGGEISARPSHSSGRWAVAAAAPLFVGFYLFNPFFLEHYPVVIIPAVMVCVFAGAHALTAALVKWRPRWARPAGVALATAVLALSVTSLWPIKGHLALPGQRTRDGFGEGSILAFVDDAIKVAVRAPAVVLFRPPPQFFAEAVYNPDVAWPDDAPIVRAHDLGERNREIIEYYADKQPARTFYLVDWEGGTIVTLGDAVALRERLRQGATVQSLMNPK